MLAGGGEVVIEMGFAQVLCHGLSELIHGAKFVERDRIAFGRRLLEGGFRISQIGGHTDAIALSKAHGIQCADLALI